MARRLVAGVCAGALGAVLALLGASTSLGRLAEAQTFDWRVAANPGHARDDIAIVEINESSVRALAPIMGRWPWPRAIHAGVIDYLARSRARVIVYDVQFTEADTIGSYRIGDRMLSGPESDTALVVAVRRAGNVVLLADALFEGLQNEPADGRATATPGLDLPGTTYAPGDGLHERPSIQLPFSALRSAAAAVGHNLLQKDPGGVSRAMFPFVRSSNVAVPSLGTAAVLLATQAQPPDVRREGHDLRVGEARLPLRDDGQALLRLKGPYAAPSGHTTFPVHAFFDVLLSEEQTLAGQTPAIPASAFAGKIVFVGTSASGLVDVHATAFGGSTPGVYLHATLADNILSREFMRRAPASVDTALTALAGLAAGAAFVSLPVWWAIAALAIAVAALTSLATRLVAGGLWIPLAAPLGAMGLTAVFGLAWQYFVEGREKRVVKRLFGRYVSPAIFQQLMTDPSLVRIGGERRNMSVLFSDIRGFTAATERTAPEAVVAQLNEYFGEMVEVLFRHHGTLDKFVGDQIMGLFGAPVADPSHADHAVSAAIEMSTVLDRLNARWTADGRPPLEIGIGINSGEMIAGNVGSEALMSYTVIGDAVNLGARLESLNKDYGTRILISQQTKDRLTTNFATRLVGEVTVKGRQEPVIVHEVIGGRT